VNLRLGVDQGKLEYQRGHAYADLISGLSLGIGLQSKGSRGPGSLDSRPAVVFTLDGAIKLMGPLGVSQSLALGMRF
jgi:hypothetical protein